VQRFIATRVKFTGVDRRDPGLERYVRLVVERVRDAIVPDTCADKRPLLPILNSYRPDESTSGVDSPTTRPVARPRSSARPWLCRPSRKSSAGLKRRPGAV